MAISKLVEPYVKVTERIHETPNLLNIDGSCNIAGVIVAPAGPRLSYVSGPKDFLQKYTVDGEIPRNADITFINAYYMSFSAGMVICRSMNTTAVKGLWFKTKDQSETKLLINSTTEGLWGMLFNNKYYWSNNGNKVFDDFVTVLSNMTNDDGDPLISADTINSIKKYANTKTEVKNVCCEDFNDLATKLAKDLGDGFSAIYSDSVGGLIISPSTTLTPDKTLTVLMSTDVNSTDSKKGLEQNEIFYKDGVALTEKDTLTFDFTKVGTDKFDGNWAFTYGTMAYYHGAIDRSKYEDYSLKSVDSFDDIASSINGINGMATEITAEYDKGTGQGTIEVNYSKGNQIFIGNDDPDTGTVTVLPVDAKGLVKQTPKNTNTYADMNANMLFAIYPAQPYDSNVFKMTVIPDSGDLFQLSLYNGAETNTYTVSLFPDAVDQSGANAFIENLNAIDDAFTVVSNPNISEEELLKDIPQLNQVFSFGDSGLDLSASKRTTSKINAIYALEDQEIYDIDYLAPFGETNLQFIKNYIYVGKKNFWFTPVDIPRERTNANSIKGYFLNVDLTSNAEGMGPFDKNTGLTGWMCYIACSTLYYQKVMTNRQANSEFAPVFDITNGILDFTYPVYMLGKADREKLLNFKAPVNFLLYDQQSSVYYLNDNWTHQSERNIVSEEQNRRIINKINRDVRKLMKRFKGRFNTVTTRADVVSLISYYFSSQIMNQNYAPNEYNIICDETNNTNEIITANKLALTVQVRLYNAIKYIDILTDVFPIGVDFNS